MKILFHISDLSKWPLLQANINNILKEDSSLDVSVVANSEAVKIFIDHNNQLLDNVNYFVCANALRANNIEHSALIENAKVTSSGVYKVALLQNEGYLYIKP